MDKAGDGPWMILMNHCSFTDLAIAFEVLKDRPFSIVCTLISGVIKQVTDISSHKLL